MKGLRACLAWRAKISASTLWVKHTLAVSRRDGRNTVACTKSNTTTSNAPLLRLCVTRSRAAGVLSLQTLTGISRTRSSARRQRGRSGVGCQASYRSDTSTSASAHCVGCVSLAGLSRVTSKAPPLSPRRMLLVRILPPASVGNRNTGEMKARRSLLTSRYPHKPTGRPRGCRRSPTGRRCAAPPRWR